ncbi:hypothetical protein GVI60_11840 [Citrobacter freundii]|uniref:hypothetical protein n=1 Tax=Citrobacter TaxID=544 RepID=UPI0009C51B99|nr:MULTISPECIES: hypothetical protein [Citrobacter]MCQ6311301.1 hypothetical protein [Citrobacter portucalensis]MDM2791215.1 hypothetical protein [Citrobacter sp. Cpo114]OPX52685.1 hypothetical protein B5P53_07415 [Citrobacter portucalensis]UKK32807.1 hypothetical protein GVI60_11840 [Citrobacter freundii]
MAEFVLGMLEHTPVWVYLLFAFLLYRGIKARTPATVTLEKLALIPAIFLFWDIYDLITYRDPTLITYIQWTIGIISGAIIGYILINPDRLSRSSAPRSIHRPADYSALPFMLLAFGVKYVLGVLNATAPDVLRQPAMSTLAIITGGMFAGVFVGKFTRYVSVWLRLPTQDNY